MLLDMETLEELRDELNNELVRLYNVERSVYKKRRRLELESNPDLLEDYYTYPLPKEQEQSKKKTIS